MSSETDHSRFVGLSFEGFRKLASDPTLSRHEKVGFPDCYREGKESDIFLDICTKISTLNLRNITVLEIGPGCSLLPMMLSSHCEKNSCNLIYVDSEEMLAHLPNAKYISKYSGVFPDALGSVFHRLIGKIDAIIVYSVIQYVFAEGNLWDFVDRCLLLLSDGGELLLGDLPNSSMRKRFFASDSGAASHRKFSGFEEKPEVLFNQLEPGQIDDSVIFSILSRARSQGFHAWVLPQASSLPMANRREDILIRKP